MKKKVENDFLAQMRSNRSYLISETQHAIKSAEGTAYEVSFPGYLFKSSEMVYDAQFALDMINNILNDDKKPIILPNGEVYYEIDVHDPTDELPEYYQTEYAQKSADSVRQFWSENKNEKLYKELSSFSSFEDIIISNHEIERLLLKRGMLFNTEGWLSYFLILVSIYLPDFKMLKSKSKIVSFQKIVNDRFSLIISYDQSWLKKNLMRGSLIFPELKIIISDHDYNSDYEIGMYNHPLFENPCMTLSKYCGKETLIKVGEGTYKFIYTPKVEDVGVGISRVFNCEKFGDKLKRYAFYYMDMNTFYTKAYMNFIEGVLKQLG